MTEMYITTFYSFKGGVGRTMALVNTAVTLALRGRRVLVVDFDIEAPGLDTFDVLQPLKETPGIIDFVAEYLRSGQAPDVAEYIGDCSDIGDGGGKLCIMPSGKIDTYAATLGQIDWMDLYEQRDGFVLFEDLRKQWSQTIEPDYVLIDSRTGHTDTSGICTRQLPDSVVVLFFPNDQNLRGLAQVVQEMRAEANEPRRKEIALHFVMSNVPDLDDEDLILRGKISAFKKHLGFRRNPMIIHRYDSLSLLNQAVFSKDRPRSRLAREYKQIAQEISSRNWNDPDGAREYIRRAGSRNRWLEDDSDSIVTRADRLEIIEQVHRQDPEILFRLAELRDSEGQSESAGQLFNQAILHGYDQPEVFLKRSQFRADNNESEGSIEDLWRVLASEHATPPLVLKAVERLSRLGIHDPHRVIRSKAAESLDSPGKFWLASAFNRSLDDLLVAVALWEQIVESSDLSPNRQQTARVRMGLSLMGLGRFEEAASCFQIANTHNANSEIHDVFNYAMAKWGMSGTIDRKIFSRVVEINESNERDGTPNYLQCMAIAYWAAGETAAAVDQVDRAQASLTAFSGRPEFSCWRYLQVSMSEFERDLHQIRSMIEKNEPLIPRFMTDAGTAADERQK